MLVHAGFLERILLVIKAEARHGVKARKSKAFPGNCLDLLEHSGFTLVKGFIARQLPQKSVRYYCNLSISITYIHILSFYPDLYKKPACSANRSRCSLDFWAATPPKHAVPGAPEERAEAWRSQWWNPAGDLLVKGFLKMWDAKIIQKFSCSMGKPMVNYRGFHGFSHFSEALETGM